MLSVRTLNLLLKLCFHPKQIKQGLEVIPRFKAKIYKLLEFKPQVNINGFSFSKTIVIIEEHP